MNQNPDILSQLLLEADGLLLLLYKHRDETPLDAVKLLRKKLSLIMALTEGLDQEEEVEEKVEQQHAVQPQATKVEQQPAVQPQATMVETKSTSEYLEDTVEHAVASTPIIGRTYMVPDDNGNDNTTSSSRRSPASIFNLNDKFRFRRELFGNSDAQYVECLDMLSAMASIDEAKEYLYDDLKWDADNDDVKAFIDILSNYYK